MEAKIKVLRSNEIREETKEEEEARHRLAQQLYDKNLQMLTPLLSRKGIWRVALNDVGEVLSALKGPISKPQWGEFALIVSGPGGKIRFGSLEHMSDVQRTITSIIIKDLTTFSQIREEAAKFSGKGSKEVDKIIDEQLSNLERRFGALPPKVEPPPPKPPADLDDNIPMTSFEDMLAAEQRKREKRRRQRERKRLEKL